MVGTVGSWLVGLGVLGLAGCGSSRDGNANENGGSGGSGGTAIAAGTSGSVGGSSGAMGAACSKDIVASEAQNYQFSSNLTIDLTKVKPSSDITFDWSGVHTDFMGKPVDLNRVTMVSVILWKMGLEQFEKRLNDDTLDMNDLEIPASIDTSSMHQTTGDIFQAQPPAGPVPMATILGYLDINSYPPENHVYTAMLADGDAIGEGTRMIQAFQLDAASTNTQVNITSDSTKLAFTATIASRPATNIPPGVADVSIDWTNMMKTASGGEFLPQQITRIRIGSYTQTPAELEGHNFLSLDELAVEMYAAEVESGTKISLAQAATKEGKTFAGIDGAHTWIVALDCGGCRNPAPWYLSVLKPCTH